MPSARPFPRWPFVWLGLLLFAKALITAPCCGPGKGADTDFSSDTYAAEILARLKTWKVLDAAANPDQIVGRITMAGLSGAGATLARMAKESVRRDKEATGTPSRFRPAWRPES